MYSNRSWLRLLPRITSIKDVIISYKELHKTEQVNLSVEMSLVSCTCAS